MSGLHCSIKYSGGAFWLSDLGSTHGTWLMLDEDDGCGIEIGDVLRMGSTTFSIYGRMGTRYEGGCFPGDCIDECCAVQ